MQYSVTGDRATTRLQVRGFVDGGVDMLIVETIFDSMNSKAAVFAVDESPRQTDEVQ